MMTTDQINQAKETYPELVQLMAKFRKVHRPTERAVLRDYKRFLKVKNGMNDKAFYEKYIKSHFHINHVDSKTFGSKDFYKTDLPVMYWDLFITI